MRKKEVPVSETLAGGVTQVQIDSWKAKHGKDKIRQIDVKKDEKTTVTCYSRFPSLDEISAAETCQTMVDKGRLLYNSCYLGGDPETREDEQVMLAVFYEMCKMFRLLSATTKNV